MQSTSATARRHRKGGSPDHDHAAEDPLLGLPTKPAEPLAYGIDMEAFGRLAAALFWRSEISRAEAMMEEARMLYKFAMEQYEKELAGLYRCTTVEPRAKRAKIVTSRKRKGSKARGDTIEDDEV